MIITIIIVIVIIIVNIVACIARSVRDAVMMRGYVSRSDPNNNQL